MKKILVWEVATRVFHWAFAAAVILSLGIALTTDDDSVRFHSHMLFGLVAAFLVVLRVVMGFVGARYTRFTAFPLRPRTIARYFWGVVTGKNQRYAGHNPGSALAAVAMFGLVASLLFTGLGLAGASEELHEILAYVLLGVIGAHLCGLLVHRLRHRENVAVAMITGRRDGAPEEGLRHSRPVWGSVFAVLGMAWIVALFANHDRRAATVKLPVIGTVIQLDEHDGEHTHHD